MSIHLFRLICLKNLSFCFLCSCDGYNVIENSWHTLRGVRQKHCAVQKWYSSLELSHGLDTVLFAPLANLSLESLLT